MYLNLFSTTSTTSSSSMSSFPSSTFTTSDQDLKDLERSIDDLFPTNEAFSSSTSTQITSSTLENKAMSGPDRIVQFIYKPSQTESRAQDHCIELNCNAEYYASYVETFKPETCMYMFTSKTNPNETHPGLSLSFKRPPVYSSSPSSKVCTFPGGFDFQTETKVLQTLSSKFTPYLCWQFKSTRFTNQMPFKIYVPRLDPTFLAIIEQLDTLPVSNWNKCDALFQWMKTHSIVKSLKEDREFILSTLQIDLDQWKLTFLPSEYEKWSQWLEPKMVLMGDDSNEVCLQVEYNVPTPLSSDADLTVNFVSALTTQFKVYISSGIWRATVGKFINLPEFSTTLGHIPTSTDLYHRLLFVLLFYKNKWHFHPQTTSTKIQTIGIKLENECLDPNKEETLLTLIGFKRDCMIRFQWNYITSISQPTSQCFFITKDIKYTDWVKLKVSPLDMKDVTLFRKPLLDGAFELIQSGTPTSIDPSIASRLHVRYYQMTMGLLSAPTIEFLKFSTQDNLNKWDVHDSPNNIDFIVRIHREDGIDKYRWMGNKYDDSYRVIHVLVNEFHVHRSRSTFQQRMGSLVTSFLQPHLIDVNRVGIQLYKELDAMTTHEPSHRYVSDIYMYTLEAIVFESRVRELFHMKRWNAFDSNQESHIWPQVWFPKFRWYYPEARSPLQTENPDPVSPFTETYFHPFCTNFISMMVLDHVLNPIWCDEKHQERKTVQYWMAKFVTYSAISHHTNEDTIYEFMNTVMTKMQYCIEYQLNQMKQTTETLDVAARLNFALINARAVFTSFATEWRLYVPNIQQISSQHPLNWWLVVNDEEQSVGLSSICS